jgi:hypothetical protein
VNVDCGESLLNSTPQERGTGLGHENILGAFAILFFAEGVWVFNSLMGGTRSSIVATFEI